MRPRHRWRLTLLLCCLAFTGLSAQTEPDPAALPAATDAYDADEFAAEPARLHPVVRALGREAALRLQLDPDQEAAVTELLREYRQDAVDFPPADLQEAALRRRGLHAAIRILLTPEQRALHDGWKGDHPAAQAPARAKRQWLDVLLEDVAAPLLEKQRSKRKGGG